MVPKTTGNAKPALPADQLPNSAYSAHESPGARAQGSAAAHAQEASAPRAPGLLTRALRAVDGTNRREKQREKLQAEVARLEKELSGTLRKAWSGHEYMKSEARRLRTALGNLYLFESNDGNDTSPHVKYIVDRSALAGELVRFIESGAERSEDSNFRTLTDQRCFLPLAYPSIDFSACRGAYADFVKTLTTDALATLCEGNGQLAWQSSSSNRRLFDAATHELAVRKTAELLTEHLPSDLAQIAGGYVGSDYS